MTPKKVLVPLDGSAQAEGILPYLETGARRGAFCLTLLHVIDPDTLERNDPSHARYLDQIAAKVEMRARDYLYQTQARLREATDRVDIVVQPGDAAETIVERAQEGGYDIIAMSTHGRSGLGRWVLGSVADKVLHTSPVPVMLVRPSDASAGETAALEATKRVLVPLDGSEMAEAAIPLAVDLAQGLGATIQLLRVAQYRMGAGFGLYVEDPSGQLERAIRDYLSEAEKLVRQHGDVPVTSTLLWGFPGSRIVDAAHAEPGGMVVMASHGRTGPSRWVLGSIADKVVRSADVPVVIVRPTA